MPLTDDDLITVSLDDLQLIRAALNSAYHQNAVLDLADQYRKLQQRASSSKLTVALNNAMNLLTEVIALAEADSEPDPEPEPSPDA